MFHRRPLTHIVPLLVVLTLLLGACDSADSQPSPFNPDDISWGDAEVDYDRYVGPLLAARSVFDEDAPTVTSDAGIETVAWDALFASEAGATIIPFDADESTLLRYPRSVPDSIEIPYPGLRDLREDELDYLARWIEAGAPGPDGTPAYSDVRRLLYVCNQLSGRVSIIDAARMRVIRNVYFEDLGQPENAKPHHTQAEPDGSAWYVALIMGDGGGSILKLSTDLALDPSSPEYLLQPETPLDGDATFEKPGMLALDASSDYLYAGRSFAASPTSNGIARVNRSTMAFETYPTINVNHPHPIAVSQDGEHVFTAALDPPNVVSVIDAESGDLVDQLTYESTDRLGFVQFGVSPDGATVVLTTQASGELFVYDFDSEAGSLELRGRVAVGDQPWHPVFSPDGSRVYVPNRISNDVAVVDPAGLAVVERFTDPSPSAPVFSEPHGSALSADGAMLYVSNRNLNGPRWTPPVPFTDAAGQVLPPDATGNLLAINTETGEVTTVLQLGTWPSGMSIYDPAE